MGEHEKAIYSWRNEKPAWPNSAHGEDASENQDVDFNADPSPQMFVIPSREPPPPNERGDAESGRAVTLLDDETYPEGGWEAWLVVFGSWCGLVAALGVLNTIGTFQTYVSTHQLSAYSEGTVGWIFSLYTALTFFCGIYIGPLFDKYGPRWLIGPGSVAVVASIMITSVCTGKQPQSSLEISPR